MFKIGTLNELFEAAMFSQDPEIVIPDVSAENTWRLLRKGVDRYWIEHVRNIVQWNLVALLRPFSELRFWEKHLARLNKEDTKHEYLSIAPRDLIDLIRTFVRKDNLKSKKDDSSRLTNFEIIELEKLYEFMKTEDGRKNLHDGITELVDKWLRELLLSEQEKYNKLLPEENDESWELRGFTALQEAIKILDRIKSLLYSNKDLWELVDWYINYVRNILICYYKNEAELASKNLDGVRTLMKRKGYGLFYKTGEALASYEGEFILWAQKAYLRYHELIKEAEVPSRKIK